MMKTWLKLVITGATIVGAAPLMGQPASLDCECDSGGWLTCCDGNNRDCCTWVASVCCVSDPSHEFGCYIAAC